MHSTPRDASDPRHDYTLDIHYSWRLTMCGHVRWKGTVNYQHVVPKGQGASFLGLEGGHRTRCTWRRKDVLVGGGGPLRSLIDAAVFIERVGVRHVSRLRVRVALRFVPVLPHMHVAKETSHCTFSERAFCTCRVSWVSSC